MGKRKNRKKIKTTRYREQQTSQQDIEMEREQLKAKLMDIRHKNSQKRLINCKETLLEFGKLSLLILLGLFILAAIGFLIWAIVAYITECWDFSEKAIMIMQVLSGIISVAVGIWALILAVRADLREKRVENKLGVYTSSSGAGVVGVNKENDVNPSSL